MTRLPICFYFILSCVVMPNIGQTQDSAKPKPLKALLITGGCCHDYNRQKNILKQGIEARALVEVSHMHSTDTSTNARFGLYDSPDWAKGYDIVLHDECSADIVEQPYVDNILNAHKNGLPAVNLHCAMHSYRIPDKDDWFRFAGIQSASHGPQKPIDITFVDRDHSITKPLENWSTINEELYNNIKLFPSAKPLARGRQDLGNRVDDYVVVWTNEFGKGRVFSTTLGHNNETVSDPRYLDLVTRGLLWACDKLNPDYLQPFAQPKTELVPVNLAKGKKATASAFQEGHPPEHAVDGNLETRWCSPDDAAGQWWQIDLGQPEDLTGCQIEWEMDGVNYRYKVEGSADGKAWNMLADQTKTDDREQSQRLKIEAKGVRYVRVTTTQLTPGCWGSFFEVEVHGTKAEKRTVTASSTLRPKRVPGLEEIKVPSGFDVTMFAAPPDVSYPTCIASTPDGTVYVGIDENGSLDRKPNRGRIVRCQDTDGDGKADDFKTFVKLESPRGIVVMTEPLGSSTAGKPNEKTTLIVLHPPTLSAFHDDDGDGVSDRSEVLVRGIGFDLSSRGADHTTNGIQIGIDGWVYVAVGDYGFVHAEGTDGKSAQLRGGGIVRVRPDGSEIEIVSRGQRNIYDVAISPTMDLFTRDNTNDGGGWNVRLSHVPQDAEMGYPSLFVNFPEEIVEPLADYGGGSPCGALFVDEPTLPSELRHQLFTCDWGRSVVYRHPLTTKDAGFTAEQESFIEVPRPTDMDIDASGNIFVSSWKDGSFTFSGPNVGYVIKVRPSGPTPIVPAESRIDSESHSIRLQAQRAILRRGRTPDAIRELVSLVAGKDHSLPIRVAAIYTLKQLLGEESHPTLFRAAMDPTVREYALKAISDRKTQLSKTPVEPFSQALKDENPRVRLVAARAISRIAEALLAAPGLKAAAEQLVAVTADPDPLVAHVAIRSLRQMNAIEPCMASLNSDRVDQQIGASRVLRHLHSPATVTGLLNWMERDSAKNSSPSQPVTLAVLTSLCRLYSRDSEWTGDWWGTRPDTSGPYYKPTNWAESDRILGALRRILAECDAATAQSLLGELKRHKIEFPEAQSLTVKLAHENSEFLPKAIDIISGLNSELTPEAGSLLEEAATTKRLDASLRARALRSLSRRVGQHGILELAIRGFSAIDEKDQQGDVAAAWEEFAREQRLAPHVSGFARIANADPNDAGASPSGRELGFAVLAWVADNKHVAKDDRDTALRELERAWTTPDATVAALRGIGRSRAESQSLQVRTLRASKDPAIQAAAEFAAVRMELDREPAFDPNKPLIAGLKFEDVVAKAVQLNGDVQLGARLFSRQGCSACHTVSPNEPLKGPLLRDITKRYKKEELLESILKPSAKIAQGFESQFFQTHDGKVYDGFVVRESGDEIEFRNVAGLATILKKSEIEERGKREASIMPQGLADKLNVDQLAAILAYLDSLKK
jgi:putative membrane-bound dehydrogenase-like protein